MTYTTNSYDQKARSHFSQDKDRVRKRMLVKEMVESSQHGITGAQHVTFSCPHGNYGPEPAR